MISHRKNFIFIHIPKTGGSSISKKIRKYGIYYQGKLYNISIYNKHVTAFYLYKTLGPEQFNKYYKFTIVRNPFNWLISNYEFNRGLHLPFVKNTRYTVAGTVPDWAKSMTFTYWIKWWLDTFNPSQTYMIESNNNKIIVDKVYKFEELFSAYIDICMKTKIFPGRLPHNKRTISKKPLNVYYNNALIDIVQENFKNDFLNFNYDFH